MYTAGKYTILQLHFQVCDTVCVYVMCTVPYVVVENLKLGHVGKKLLRIGGAGIIITDPDLLVYKVPVPTK
jgi:hypothetical protein